MKIYTKVVYDWDGNILEEDSFEYQGPVAECKGEDVPEPEMSTEEKDLLVSQKEALDLQSQLLESQMASIEAAKLEMEKYAPTPEMIEQTKRLSAQQLELTEQFYKLTSFQYQQAIDTAPDQAAFLKAKLDTAQAELKTQNTINEWIQTELTKEPTKLEKLSEEIGILKGERTKAAFEGTLALSETSIKKKQNEFEILKESQARIGNTIVGDDPDTAVGTTTAGIQALEAFQSKWKLADDAESRDYMFRGAESFAGSVGLEKGIESTKFNQFANLYRPTSAGYSISSPGFDIGAGYGTIASTGQYGYGALTSGASSLASGYQAATQPYAQYSQMGLQANIQNSQAAAAASGGMWGAIGSLAGGIATGGLSYAGSLALKAGSLALKKAA